MSVIMRLMTDVLLMDPTRVALTRSNGWLSIPREPASEMLQARAHVAVVTWAQRWVAASSGRVIGWAVAVDVEGQRTRVLSGRTTAEKPIDELRAAVLKAVAGQEDSIWIVVPKKRLGLARSLRNQGLPVTAGFRGRNRAEAALTEYSDAERIALHAEALAQDSRNQFGVDGKPAVVPTESSVREWWPSGVWLEDDRNLEYLVIAADSSMGTAEHERSFGRCAISDGGDVVFDTGLTRGQIGSLELDAITLALGIVNRRAPSRATVFSDSTTALRFVWEVTDVHAGQQEYRGLAHDARKRFLKAYRGLPPDVEIEFQHVQGHGSIQLMLAADEIAGIARRASTVPRDQIEAQLEQRINEIRHSGRR